MSFAKLAFSALLGHLRSVPPSTGRMGEGRGTGNRWLDVEDGKAIETQ